MKKMNNVYLAGLLVMAVLTSSGCAALLLGAVAGAGTVTYMQGDLKQNVDQPIKKAHAATLKALKDLDIFIFNEVLNVADASINGEYKDGTKVKVSIEALTEKASTIRVRVGVVGDEEKSRAIMTQIEKRL